MSGQAWSYVTEHGHESTLLDLADTEGMSAVTAWLRRPWARVVFGSAAGAAGRGVPGPAAAGAGGAARPVTERYGVNDSQAFQMLVKSSRETNLKARQGGATWLCQDTVERAKRGGRQDSPKITRLGDVDMGYRP